MLSLEELATLNIRSNSCNQLLPQNLALAPRLDMNDPIDQLLSEMKGKYNPQDSQPNTSKHQSSQTDAPLPAQPKQSSSPLPKQPDQSIDDLLSAIESPNQQSATSAQKPIVPIQPSKNPKFDALLHPPHPNPQVKPNPKLDTLLPSEQPTTGKAGMENLLTDLKAIYTEQDQAIEWEQKQQQAVEQQRQQAFQRQQEAKIKREAQAWLNQLDAESSEAAWFEEFAAKYDSRIAAAIDYLGLK